MRTNPTCLSRNLRSSEHSPLQSREISSLSRRFLAFIVDVLILYILGRVLGTLLFDALSRIGPYCLLVGFSVALLYFGLLDSSVGNGKTVGKRLLRLKVVEANGKPISLFRSIVRFSLFAAPHFLNRLELPETRITWIAPLLITSFAYAIGGISLYLLVFNRRTRQGLHDLAVGSYVTRDAVAGPVKTEMIWDVHWVVLKSYLLMIVLISMSIGFLAIARQNSGYVGPKLRDTQLIEKLDLVQAARVRDWIPISGLTWLSGLTKHLLPNKRVLAITVRWKGVIGEEEATADQIARIVLQNDPSVRERDFLSIHVSCGYDLGIASSEHGKTFTRTPNEWQERLLNTLSSPSSQPPNR